MAKYKIMSCLLCQDVRQEVSGQQSIVGLFSQSIRSKTVPLMLPQLQIRIELSAEEEIRERGRVIILTPSRVAMVSQEVEITVQRGVSGVVIVGVVPAIFSEPGTYQIRFGLVGKESTISRWRIDFETPAMAAEAEGAHRST
jgi:hypothetical protein